MLGLVGGSLRRKVVVSKKWILYLVRCQRRAVLLVLKSKKKVRISPCMYFSMEVGTEFVFFLVIKHEINEVSSTNSVEQKA